jgi:hypothetical protein
MTSTTDTRFDPHCEGCAAPVSKLDDGLCEACRQFPDDDKGGGPVSAPEWVVVNTTLSTGRRMYERRTGRGAATTAYLVDARRWQDRDKAQHWADRVRRDIARGRGGVSVTVEQAPDDDKGEDQ